MKSQMSLKASSDAALDRALRKCQELEVAIIALHGDTPQKRMPRVRAILAELTQRVHEHNAYRNALETN